MSEPADRLAEPDPELREALLRRYGRMRPDGFWQRLRFQSKRLAWKAVVGSVYVFKRLLDIAASAVLILLLTPLFLTIMLLIRLESPGPIFFRQIRVGRWGALFTMWKFRSMYIDAEARKAALLADNDSGGGVIFKMKQDPRITKVGRFIRKASIDELPQLWNVLVGDMSLVGPRPALPSEVNQYSLADRRRLEVIPGITCIWQVSGRSDIPFPEQVKLDVQYIESSSFWQDLLILLKTVPAVLLGRGAY
ncbi:MAG: sugar transferase [Candidatus Contendobacter sp.]|jgi:exopolysaccharide biosynthesis polyprenyl glycosylphosphotransferase|nr:sugar transferase [Candidatus Contendobacter sp.]